MSFLGLSCCCCLPLLIGVPLLLVALKLFMQWKYPMFQIKRSPKGKVFLITGASAGIGTDTVAELAKHGAVVHCLCRDMEKAQRVLGPFQDLYGKENVQIHHLDLCDFASIKRFAAKFLATNSPIHCLINNAGLMSMSHQYTKDGFEKTFQSNHLGHFLLTKLLLDRVVESAPSRIINLSSSAHTFVKRDEFDLSDVNFRNRSYGMQGMQAYCWSKLENVLYTRELARRLYDKNVTVNAVHPGAVKTEFIRVESVADYFKNPIVLLVKFSSPILFKNSLQGAQTTLYAALSEELDHVTGSYFADCRPETMTALAQDHRLAEEFYQESEKMIANVQ